MIFGTCLIDDTEGAILAHRLDIGEITYKKGHLLTLSDISLLRSLGYSSLIVARPEAGDIDENNAALTVAKMVQGANLDLRQPFTGRCNIYAKAGGLLIYDNTQLDSLNLINESITLAALPNFSPVLPGQLVATIKIIPFFISQSVLNACHETNRANSPLFHVAPFQKKTVALIQTEILGIKPSVYAKTSATMKKRIEALGSTIKVERRCPHASPDIAKTLEEVLTFGCDLVMISGASAIVDRHDVIPSAIVGTGGSVIHFGMPVDPGNLLLLASSKNSVPILGLPGCARSPKTNGLDWVLQRLHAGLSVSGKDIQLMGGGGLLTEAEEEDRPLLRNPPSKIKKIGAVILAAGLSSRMNGANKLLEKINGIPIIVHTVQNTLKSKARPIILVVGNSADSIRMAFSKENLTDIHIITCSTYAMGLSNSLKTGITALPSNIEGAIICLADMPFVTPDDIDRLIAAFNPAEKHLIAIPTHKGRRGNPVLCGKEIFPHIAKLEGDKGASQIWPHYEKSIIEVELSHEGILTDIDSPDDLLKAQES